MPLDDCQPAHGPAYGNDRVVGQFSLRHSSKTLRRVMTTQPEYYFLRLLEIVLFAAKCKIYKWLCRDVDADDEKMRSPVVIFILYMQHFYKLKDFETSQFV